jgi:2,3-bisphosphoglycerate-independent phosphoglycerate mutase
VAAVDLVRGIGRSLELDIIDVEGATGYVHTNFAGKGQAAIDALHDYDFVFVHIEAPDEAGHEGDIQAKVDAIEAIDSHIVGPVLDVLQARGDGRLLVLPDHPTPIDLRTHVHEAVPFAWCGQGAGEPSGRDYTEQAAAETGLLIRHGHELMGTFLADET